MIDPRATLHDLAAHMTRHGTTWLCLVLALVVLASLVALAVLIFGRTAVLR